MLIATHFFRHPSSAGRMKSSSYEALSRGERSGCAVTGLVGVSTRVILIRTSRTQLLRVRAQLRQAPCLQCVATRRRTDRIDFLRSSFSHGPQVMSKNDLSRK